MKNFIQFIKNDKLELNQKNLSKVIKDIDIEKTVDKRTIVDNGFFYDELTGEMIFNSDLKYHPYSHEDEIIVKNNSNPRIINIKKINLK